LQAAPGTLLESETCGAGGGTNGTVCRSAAVLTDEALEAMIDADGFAPYVDQPYDTDVPTYEQEDELDLDAARSTLDTDVEAGAWVDTILDPEYDGFTIPAPEGDETYEAYVSRLVALGYVGESALVVLTYPETYDPAYDASVIVRTSPAVGSHVPANTAITVYMNPEDAPGAVESGAPFCDCPPPDLEPLTGLDYGENFPFGIFTWVLDTLDVFDAESEAPVITVPIIGTALLGDAQEFTVDFSFWDDYVAWMRSVISWLLWLGAIWYVGTRMLRVDYADDPSASVDDLV
jgi:hypothetical protein